MIEQLVSVHHAPERTGDREAWRDQALCAQTDIEAFHPPKGGSTKRAKEICAECPVAAACLQWALDNHEWSGVWGGLAPAERRALKRVAA